MKISDPIADMLTRLRNAGHAGLPEAVMPASKMKEGIAKVLLEAGFIADVAVESEGAKKDLRLTLKYHNKQPVIEGIRRVSKPSHRVYVGVGDIPRVMGGLGLAILSTPQGILSGKQARQQNTGGEVLCYVW